MTVVRPNIKPCVVTDCFLQPTCAQQSLVPTTFQDTAILINEQPQTSILDTIAQSNRRLQGTPVSLECGGDAFILNKGNHTLYLGSRAPTIARLATTIGPHPERGITTEVLLLAGHRIAPSGEMSSILNPVNPEPTAAIDDVSPVGDSDCLKPWVLNGSELEIVGALSMLTSMLTGIVNGIKTTLTPDLSGQASLGIHVDTNTNKPQMITVDLQSTTRRDGFLTTQHLIRNAFERIELMRILKSLGFEQK